MGMGRERDRQDYQDLDGLRWTIFARMDRIVGIGMGLDGQDCLDGVEMRKVGPDCQDGDWQ